MNPIPINGVTYRSLHEAAAEYGLPYQTVRLRLTKLRWSLEEALKTPSQQREKRVRVQGKLYRSITEAARHFDIPVTLVYYRKNALGWSVQEALTVPRPRRVGS